MVELGRVGARWVLHLRVSLVVGWDLFQVGQSNLFKERSPRGRLCPATSEI